MINHGCCSLCRLAISIVQGTDMMFHLRCIGNVHTLCSEVASSCDGIEHAWAESSFRHPLMILLVHTADISAPTRPPHLAGMWTKAVYDEFFRQGNLEVSFGLPPTPFLQPHLVTIWNSQVGITDAWDWPE
jgi:hypothetical protein